MDIVKHNARFCKASTFPKDISEDYAGFGGGYLDVIGIISICKRAVHLAIKIYLNGSFDAQETMGRKGMYCWSLDELEVTQRREVQDKVLQRIRRLIDQ